MDVAILFWYGIITIKLYHVQFFVIYEEQFHLAYAGSHGYRLKRTIQHFSNVMFSMRLQDPP